MGGRKELRCAIYNTR